MTHTVRVIYATLHVYNVFHEVDALSTDQIDPLIEAEYWPHSRVVRHSFT